MLLGKQCTLESKSWMTAAKVQQSVVLLLALIAVEQLATCEAGYLADLNAGYSVGFASFVGGGEDNRALSDFSVIVGGGKHVTHGELAFIGGGQGHTAAGAFSLVVGGQGNGVFAEAATVGGGRDNTVLAYVCCMVSIAISEPWQQKHQHWQHQQIVCFEFA